MPSSYWGKIHLCAFPLSFIPCQAEPDSTPTLGLPALKGTREAASRTEAEANPWSKGGRTRLVGWAWHGSGAQATETSTALRCTDGGALAGWGQGVRSVTVGRGGQRGLGSSPGPVPGLPRANSQLPSYLRGLSSLICEVASTALTFSEA